MGKNKWMEKMGVYGTAPDKKAEDLLPLIEESVSSLGHWRKGGEKEAAEAYCTILDSVPQEYLKDSVLFAKDLIAKDIGNRGKGLHSAGEKARKLASCLSDVFKLPEVAWKVAYVDFKETASTIDNTNWVRNLVDDYMMLAEGFPKKLDGRVWEAAMENVKDVSLKNQDPDKESQLSRSYVLLANVLPAEDLPEKFGILRKMCEIDEDPEEKAKGMASKHLEES